jgi:hypothetical protein
VPSGQASTPVAETNSVRAASVTQTSSTAARRDICCGRDRGDAELGADDTGGIEHAPLLRSELLDPLERELSEAVGDDAVERLRETPAAAGRGEEPALQKVRDGCRHEEWIPAGSRVDRTAERWVDRRSGEPAARYVSTSRGRQRFEVEVAGAAARYECLPGTLQGMLAQPRDRRAGSCRR